MKYDTLPLLKELAPEVTAFVTLRGFSLCHYTDDDPASVTRCKKALAEALEIDEERLVIPTQTHSVNVASADEPLSGVDAVVTDKPNIALCINTADCLPLLMADPQAGVIAAAHCGWKGAAGGIAANTVKRMVAMGASPARIHAAMGPCICPECFEVGEEVACRFPEQAVIRKPDTKPHVDLGEAVRMQLLDAGLEAGKITKPAVCTKHTTDFYSVRREGYSLKQRMASVIVLRGRKA